MTAFGRLAPYQKHAPSVTISTYRTDLLHVHLNHLVTGENRSAYLQRLVSQADRTVLESLAAVQIGGPADAIVTASFHLPEPILLKIDEIASNIFTGNRSASARALIRADAAAHGDGLLVGLVQKSSAAIARLRASSEFADCRITSQISQGCLSESVRLLLGSAQFGLLRVEMQPATVRSKIDINNPIRADLETHPNA